MTLKWKLLIAPAGAALLGASALAYAADSGAIPFSDATVARAGGPANAEPCPPEACSIVYKTARNGPPSQVIDLR